MTPIAKLREAIVKQEKLVARQADFHKRKVEAEKLNLMYAQLRDLERFSDG